MVARISKALVASCFAAGIALAGAVPAGADDQIRQADIAATVSLASGPVCAGLVNVGAVSARALHQQIYPGSPQTRLVDNRGMLQISGSGGFFGISHDLSRPCETLVTVTWRNLATGAAGAASGVVSGTLIPAAPLGSFSVPVRTGSGPVELRVTTDHPHVSPGSVIINVF